MSILGILLRIAIPHFDSSRMQITVAQRVLIANLRQARANAISKNVHYQLSFPTTTQIRVARMVENPVGSGTWQVDATNIQTIAMPKGTSVTSSLVSTAYEFSARGLVVTLNTVKQIDAQDGFGVTKSLQVWPSGQVNEL